MAARNAQGEAEATKGAADMDKFILRLPGNLRDEIKRVAAKRKRSMNAELLARLDTYDELFSELQKQSAEAQKWHADYMRQTLENAKLQGDIHLLRDSLQREYDSRKVLDANRLPEGLARRIQQSAQQRGRAFEEEVTQTLEKAYPPPDAFGFIAEMTLLLKPLEGWNPKEDTEVSRAITNTRIFLDYLKREYAEGREQGAFDRFYQEYEIGPDGIRRSREGNENVGS